MKVNCTIFCRVSLLRMKHIEFVRNLSSLLKVWFSISRFWRSVALIISCLAQNLPIRKESFIRLYLCMIPSQFTKQGHIFVCVRILDTCHSDRLDPPPELINQPSRSKLFTLGSGSGTQVVPKSPSGSDTTGRVGSDRDTIYRGGSTRLSEMHLVAPRLSMAPGPLSTREAVAAWRRWKPKGPSEIEELKPVTVVVSVEDTGAPSFSSEFMGFFSFLPFFFAFLFFCVGFASSFGVIFIWDTLCIWFFLFGIVGIGIPLHLHNRLFQPFLQADRSNTREYGGTGVGLSICKVHLDMMFCMLREKMFVHQFSIALVRFNHSLNI